MRILQSKFLGRKALIVGTVLALGVIAPGVLMAQSGYGSGYGSGEELVETPKIAPQIERKQDAASAYEALLGRYVSAPDAQGLNHFNYGGLLASTEDTQVLETYIAVLEVKNPDALSDAAATAYWANLYNAVTVRVVAEHYPVKSILKIKSGLRSGPWRRNLIIVNGKPTSLDDIEHGILRKSFPSPLIHYMVNCASVGCPNLLDKLWTAETLDADREQAARDFINSPRGAKITENGLKVSSIYKWFKEDFGGNKAGVLKHLREYAGPELAEAIDGGAKIVGYDYDWSLNE